ncbi:MAG TPA: hypothetical protein VGA13_04000, partial [Acidimicrobiales bacterium]
MGRNGARRQRDGEGNGSRGRAPRRLRRRSFGAGVAACALVVVGILSGAIAGATTLNVFDGDGDGSSWHDPFNWSLGHEPQVGDEAVIPTGFDVQITGAATADLATVDSGASLTVSGGSAELALVGSVPVLDVDGSIVVTGSGGLRGLTLDLATAGSSFGVGSFSTGFFRDGVTVVGDLTLGNGDLHIFGSLVMDSGDVHTSTASADLVFWDGAT